IHRDALRKKGVRVYLLVPRLKAYPDHDILTLPSQPLLRLNKYRIPVPFSWKNLARIKKIKIDLIHTHTPFSLGVYALFLGKILKVPLLHTYHTFFEEYLHYVKLQNNFGRWLAKAFSRWYCSHMSHVIVPSNFIRDLLHRYGIRKKIDVIPTGINFRRFNKRISVNWRKKLGIPAQARILLYVGRLEQEKNLYFLVDLFKGLLPDHKDIFLVLTGDGSEKKHLMRYSAKQGLSGRVLFTGFIQPCNLHDIYGTADLFVFPSLTETEGLVLLEAMVNDLPVVSFYERGTKTLLPGHIRPGISPVRTEEQFRDEVEKYLKNRYRSSEIRRNLRHYILNFNEDIFINKLINIYRLYTGDGA
ncbi:MAG: glycosyltransferase, partial [bacterium]|nr:glycosyltransferase [bacterium]